MATIDEAKLRWQQLKESFVPRTPTRVAFLGDGIGFAASNMTVAANPAYIFARERLEDKNFFPVLNRNIVRPAFNMPVILGFTEDEPNFEQVLSVHWSAFEHQTNASIIGGIGPHHTQHEWGGGDEIFIDSRQFKRGLAKPTVPPSMQVIILPFIYYYDEWKRFNQTTSIDLTTYLPASNLLRYVLIAVDPRTNTLVYRPGHEFSTADWGAVLGNTMLIPPPSGDELPLTGILLENGTTKIDWHTATVDNIYDARLHLGFPHRKIIERLDNLEGSLGSHPSLPTTGGAGRTTSVFPGTIDGGVF